MNKHKLRKLEQEANDLLEQRLASMTDEEFYEFYMTIPEEDRQKLAAMTTEELERMAKGETV